MAAAAKLALVPAPDPEEALSAAEEYALLSGEEIFAASQETSRIYNGRVLAKAVLLVQTRIQCHSLNELAKCLGIPRQTCYRRARGVPCSANTLHRALRDLAYYLDEQGVSLKRAI